MTHESTVSAPGEHIAVPMSLKMFSPGVAALDFCWIVSLGVSCGLIYEALVSGGSGEAARYLGSSVALAMLYAVFAYGAGLYSAANLLRVSWQVRRSAVVWTTVFLFAASLAFVLKIGALFSRGEMLLFFTSGMVMNVTMRLTVANSCHYVISSGVLTPNQIVLVGAPEELSGNGILRRLEECGYAVAASFVVPPDPCSDIETLRARVQPVIRRVREGDVDEVLLAFPWSRSDDILAVENELRMLPVPIKLVPDMIAARVLSRPLLDLGPTKAVELQRAPLSITQRYLKRTMDQVLAASGLFVLAPFILVIAAAIRLETPGPALFLQTRVGFNGRTFKIFKFRTMSARDDGAVIVQAKKGDKRITQLGGLLRKLSIDELPQLINVIRGDMSLVGPRPHALAHDNDYARLISTYAIRHKMKPGITGWAQVNGFRGETPELGMMRQRIESDLWYIEYWSLWLDIRILLLTVVRVMKSQNAY